MAKQGLRKIWNLKTKLVSFGRGGNRREERRGEEEKEEKRKKEESSQKGMETHLVYESYEIKYEFPCFDGYPLAQI